MSKKVDFKLERVAGPPEGSSWVWHTLDLMTSAAWKARSHQLARLLELLEVEHMKHGGAENGHIHQTYSQIQAGGIARKYISATIGEGESLGLIAVQHGLRKSSTESYMTRFRLTYLSAKVINPEEQGGKPYYSCATDEWKRVTAEHAQAISERANRDRAAASGHKKSEKCHPQREPKWFPNGNSASSPTGTEPPKSRRNLGPENPASVPQREHPSISWEDTADQAQLVSDTEQPSVQPITITLPSPTDLGQTPNRQAGRRQHGQDEHNSEAPSLLDFIDAQNDKTAVATINPSSPTDRLRDGTKAKLATSERGTQKALALLIGVSPSHLSNFLGGRFSLTNGAVAMLQDWLDGRKVIASPKEAAA